jgi:hypothetical protein
MSAKELVQTAKRRKLGEVSGMDASELRRLIDEDQVTECAICFEEFTDGAILKQWPCNPNHVFHLTCSYAYAVRKASEKRTEPITCPLCRSPLLNK